MAAGEATTRFMLKLALAGAPRLSPDPPSEPAGPAPEATPPVKLLPLTSTDSATRRYRLERPGAPDGEVVVEPHAASDWQSSLYEQGEDGFADLYEPVDGIGDAAAWTALAHTLRVRSGEWRVTVELDRPFGADVADDELELACEAARAVLGRRSA
jgi:hypothetical protein